LKLQVAVQAGLFEEFFTFFEGLPPDIFLLDVFRVLDFIKL
jgi:hypothetical protein